jgi:NADH:ubiquinone oxidoreductase subunit 4 (subunit M)
VASSRYSASQQGVRCLGIGMEVRRLGKEVLVWVTGVSAMIVLWEGVVREVTGAGGWEELGGRSLMLGIGAMASEGTGIHNSIAACGHPECSLVLVGIELTGLAWIYSMEYKEGEGSWACLGMGVMSTVLYVSGTWMGLLTMYELQTVPLLYMLVGQEVRVKGRGTSAKGIGQAVGLLVGYSLVSGVLVMVGLVSTWGEGALGGWLLYIGGGIKVALAPGHSWLCKVHVEASTSGSALLAGISLKTGYYIHVRWIEEVREVIAGDTARAILVGGAMYGTASILRQIDTKRWVALFSITHMHILYLLWGSAGEGNDKHILLGMVGHSIISAGMFFIVGYLVDVTGTRGMGELTTLGMEGPLRRAWISLILANGSYPGTILFRVEATTLARASTVDLGMALTILSLSSVSLITALAVVSRGSRTHTGRKASTSTLTALTGSLAAQSTLLCLI